MMYGPGFDKMTSRLWQDLIVVIQVVTLKLHRLFLSVCYAYYREIFGAGTWASYVIRI
jgi:hypothetical protein